jgi:hypothetical protein
MTPLLRQAIEYVYKSFRDVPKPASVDSCPCCIDKTKICVLLSKPLRNLTPDDLSDYASDVFLTCGAVEDFLYYLPRILEILATELGWWPDPEVVARAIYTSGYHSWPEHQRQSVANYFDTMMNDLINTEDSGTEIDSWICALGRLHVDLAPFLRLIAAKGPRLIEYYEINSQPLIDGRLANGFWDDAPSEKNQIMNWFRSPGIQEAIKAEYGLE